MVIYFKDRCGVFVLEVLIVEATDCGSTLTLMDFDRFSIAWESDLIYKDRSPAKMKCHKFSLWFSELTSNVRTQRFKMVYAQRSFRIF